MSDMAVLHEADLPERFKRLEEKVDRILLLVESLQETGWELIARQDSQLAQVEGGPGQPRNLDPNSDLHFGLSKSDNTGAVVDQKWYPNEGRFISYEDGWAFCNRCKMWATQGHMESKTHRSRVQHWLDHKRSMEEAAWRNAPGGDARGSLQ